MKVLQRNILWRSTPGAQLLRRASPRVSLALVARTMLGMTGVELAEELLRIKPGIPVMVITGYGTEQIPTEKGLMFNKILFKPFGKSNLILTIGDAMHIWLTTKDAPLTSHTCCGTIHDTRRNSA